MTKKFAPEKNYEETQAQVGYVPRKQADSKTYSHLGFKCGLEIHQQLKTAKKLLKNTKIKTKQINVKRIRASSTVLST